MADLKIKEYRDHTSMRIVMEGNLDAVTTKKFETLLRSSIDGVTEIILDLDKLGYISSAGLRVLYAAQNAMNKVKGSLLICNVQPDIREVFDVTGLSGILMIKD